MNTKRIKGSSLKKYHPSFTSYSQIIEGEDDCYELFFRFRPCRYKKDKEGDELNKFNEKTLKLFNALLKHMKEEESLVNKIIEKEKVS